MMMIIGCDFHLATGTIAWVNIETGECGTRYLQHGGEAAASYRGLRGVRRTDWLFGLVMAAHDLVPMLRLTPSQYARESGVWRVRKEPGRPKNNSQAPLANEVTMCRNRPREDQRLFPKRVNPCPFKTGRKSSFPYPGKEVSNW